MKGESEIDPTDSVAHATGRKLNYLIIGAMAVAIVLLLPDRLVTPRDSNTMAGAAAMSSSIASTATSLPQSIAVLAFHDLSAVHDQNNFSAGMAEEILNALTRVKALSVIGRSSPGRTCSTHSRDFSRDAPGLRPVDRQWTGVDVERIHQRNIGRS